MSIVSRALGSRRFGSRNRFTQTDGVIPKPRAFTSGARDLPLVCSRLGHVEILPILRQVIPARIRRFDELYFLLSAPRLNFLFPIDCGVGIDKMFVVDEASQVVTAGEACDEPAFVLPHSVPQIAGDSHVQYRGLRSVSHDVNQELL
jgi:hypothetical protein